MNIYTFKVTFYGDRNTEFWYPPIQAKTYSQAVHKLYNNSDIESATLKCIALPDGTAIAGTKNLSNPTNYDLK